MAVMVPLVFFINGITKGDWLDAFLFGISIAVGLTPEMLPMIVTTCLAKGAVSMSKKATDSPTCFKTDFSANKTPSLLSFDWKAKVFINICGY